MCTRKWNWRLEISKSKPNRNNIFLYDGISSNAHQQKKGWLIIVPMCLSPRDTGEFRWYIESISKQSKRASSSIWPQPWVVEWDDPQAKKGFSIESRYWSGTLHCIGSSRKRTDVLGRGFRRAQRPEANPFTVYWIDVFHQFAETRLNPFNCCKKVWRMELSNLREKVPSFNIMIGSTFSSEFPIQIEAPIKKIVTYFNACFLLHSLLLGTLIWSGGIQIPSDPG